MSRRSNWRWVAIGVTLVLAGLWALSRTRDTDTTATTPIPTTTTTNPPPPTTLPPTPTTTTSTPTTTSSTIPPETVAEFVDLYVAALESDDAEFLLERLHPVVVNAYGRDLCRSWIEREVLGLSDYRINGDITGPATQTNELPTGAVELSFAYRAPVEFVFAGETVAAEAGFARVGRGVRWVGVWRWSRRGQGGVGRWHFLRPA